MHKSSKETMREFLKAFVPHSGKTINLLDVGSYDVNGNYREVLPPDFAYTGVDLAAGPNVDFIMESEYSIPFPDNHFDIVISGQCIEHCRNPFKLIAEMGRVMKHKGALIVTAPFVWREHRYPIDTFRYLPDGMRALFDDAGLTTVKAFLNDANNGYGGVDCWGLATKD